MFPSFELFGKTIPTYGLSALVGMIVSGIFAEYAASRKGQRPFAMAEVLLISLIGVFLGSRILYAITNLHLIGRESFFTIFGGSVFYGGLLGGLLTGYLVIKKKGYPLALFSDICAVSIPLFHGFGRIGCFLGGCCYGMEWHGSFPHAIFYRSPLLTQVTTRLPVQLYESAAEFFLSLILYLLYRRGKLQGKLLPLYLSLYAVIRFFNEFLRGDELRGFMGPFSTSQWVSLAILLTICVFSLIKKLSRGSHPGRTPLHRSQK